MNLFKVPTDANVFRASHRRNMIGGDISESRARKDPAWGGVGAANRLLPILDLTCPARADFREIPCGIYHTLLEA